MDSSASLGRISLSKRFLSACRLALGVLQKSMLRSNVSPVLITLLLISCGGDPATAPSSVATPAPILVVSAPTPAPTAENLQAETYCVPKPPPIFDFKIKVQQDFGYKKILDSRALVGPDAVHCASINAGGTVCVVRREEDPQATTCNNLVVGKSDSGLYGPNWFDSDDNLCRPAGQGGNDPGCRQHETNQYLVYVFGPGRYTACSASAVCTTFVVP